MQKNSIEIKIYKVIFIVLLISAIIILAMIIYKYGSNQINEKESREFVEAFSNIDFTNTESTENQIDYLESNNIIYNVPYEERVLD